MGDATPLGALLIDEGLLTDAQLDAALAEQGRSGKPLRDRSTELVRCIFRKTNGQLPIIGVGGVMNPLDAIEKLEAGATLVQVYTGLVYAGPSLVKHINRALAGHYSSLGGA